MPVVCRCGAHRLQCIKLVFYGKVTAIRDKRKRHLGVSRNAYPTSGVMRRNAGRHLPLTAQGGAQNDGRPEPSRFVYVIEPCRSRSRLAPHFSDQQLRSPFWPWTC
jgi:hypothetical protein